MALTNGPNLGLLVNGTAGEEHYDEVLAQWRGFDVLIQCAVLDRDLAAPPGSPANGAAYIVAASASGAWTGHTGKIARYSSLLTAWEFFTPKAGWRAFVVDELTQMTYSGSAWTAHEARLLVLPNNQTGTTYTFTLSDASGGKVVRQSNASAITTTVPANSTAAFPVGSVLVARQISTGQITLSPAGGVTINIPETYLGKTAGAGSVLMLNNVATDVWDLTGGLAKT